MHPQCSYQVRESLFNLKLKEITLNFPEDPISQRVIKPNSPPNNSPRVPTSIFSTSELVLRSLFPTPSSRKPANHFSLE